MQFLLPTGFLEVGQHLRCDSYTKRAHFEASRIADIKIYATEWQQRDLQNPNVKVCCNADYNALSAYSLYSTPEYLYSKMEHHFMLDNNMALFVVVEGKILTNKQKREMADLFWTRFLPEAKTF
uniref:Uncharacterized protein n=1 Tax=Romanomermis culicivorax TaxID=13658 RepID=A0A915IIL8_ROMCU